jgi:hypothetical protein
MFEPVIRTVDATHGMWVGALSGSADTAAAMAHQAAKEGHDYAGPVGGMVGGALGWAYGSIVGMWMGALQGTMVGAKHYTTKDSQPVTPTPPMTPEPPPPPPEPLGSI